MASRVYLSRMSYGECWFSESPEAQSHLDVDLFRPKLEARRDEKVCDKPGYEWLAFSWDNFRLSAQLSNRSVRNEETDETDGNRSNDRCHTGQKPSSRTLCRGCPVAAPHDGLWRFVRHA